MSIRTRNLLSACALLLAASTAIADNVALGAFSVSTTLPELVGAESASRFEGVIAPDEAIEWELYVPETYDPGNPAGLMVYISPSVAGKIPEQWKAVMAASNLIWIGANSSGNRTRVSRRATYAIFAPTVVARHYRVDASRVYVSGFSGGGRVASMVAPQYPQIFKGAIFICGVETTINSVGRFPGLTPTSRKKTSEATIATISVQALILHQYHRSIKTLPVPAPSANRMFQIVSTE